MLVLSNQLLQGQDFVVTYIVPIIVISSLLSPISFYRVKFEIVFVACTVTMYRSLFLRSSILWEVIPLTHL